jgi:alanyl-tRNA synthetase
MKQFTSDELRTAWVNFYKERGHVDIGAVSLVSDGSTGVMFNVAGMQSLMPNLLGEKHPKGTRLCNVQGCVRTNDIESVGDKSHVTFFEMMGSWSLGDYFKEERCKWSYELLTEVLGFDRDHLAATVFAGDDNAPRDEEGAKFRIASGFKPENIFFLPAEDNWWGLEYGPCGPDSEMFYIADVPDCGPDCGPGCHCGKYTELGNDVFMQYEKHKDGSLTPLKQKNVDTGWGLERILAFLNGSKDVYMTDLFKSVIEYIEEASGIKYDSDEKLSRSMRILADHLRTSVMLIGDEAKLLPSNAGAGYVLRRLIRRAVRHGRTLNLTKDNFLAIADMYISRIYRESYPLLAKNHDFILDELEKEILRFESTLENGMKEFKKILSDKKDAKETVIDGHSAFYLYDTFGFPIELTVEMAEEEGLTVDEAGFKASMEEQKQKARDNQKTSANLNISTNAFSELPDDVTSKFVGYDKLTVLTNISAIADENGICEGLKEGAAGTIVTPETTFYATMGGQKGDIGYILGDGFKFEVTDTVKLPGNRIGHVGHVVNGVVRKCVVEMRVDAENRKSTSRNHSATHLLQAALQEVLGAGVEQQGSYQDPLRTRFDFSYGKAMTQEEIDTVERIVNEKISDNLSVITEEMSIEDAKASGAMALFGEKYGETVRVVSMGTFSKELCGGTHVAHTGDILSFKILSESGVSAGVRRIEAITGLNVLSYYKEIENLLDTACKTVKTQQSNLVDRLEHLVSENKALASEVESLKSKAAGEAAGDVLKDVKNINSVKAIFARIDSVDMNGLRDLSDNLNEKIGGGVVFLASSLDDKVNLVCKASDEAMKKGAHAGNLIKEVASLVGGGGGGRPNMAQAGGKDPNGIDACLKKAEEVLSNMIK